MSTIFLLVFSNLLSDEGFFFHWSPIFLLGIYLALYKTRFIEIVEFISTSIILGAFIFFRLEWEVFLFALFAFSVLYFEPKYRNRMLLFFGNISYSLYLCHTLVAFAFINLGLRYGNEYPFKLLFIILAIGVTILFSLLLYEFVEKPSKEKASAIKYK